MKQLLMKRLPGLFLLLAIAFASPMQAIAQDHGAADHSAPISATDTQGHASAASTDHGGHAEGHGHAEEAGIPELPTYIHLLNHNVHVGDKTLGETGFGKFLKTYERQIYLLFWVGMLTLGFFSALKLTAHRPGRMQVALEMLVEGLTTFFTGIVGKEHRKHVPFLCSLFLFIWVNNLSALIPGFAPATGIFQTTVTLAVLVFFYFIFYGIKEGGFGHFIWHLAGSPKDAIGWIISPAMFVLEVVGTLAKPLSLSLRLFGNIMGEDVLLGVFLILGLMVGGAIMPDPIIGVPLHLPFLFLVLLGSTIQALVFSLLAAIYLAMVLPHHDHHESEDSNHIDSHPLLPGAEEANENSGHVDAGVVPFV